MQINFFADDDSRKGDFLLRRRGIDFGRIELLSRPKMPEIEEIKRLWRNNEAIFLPSILADSLPRFEQDIAKAHRLMEHTLDGVDVSEQFATGEYAERLNPHFSLSGTSYEDNDDQGIEKIYFDAWEDDDIVADDLWCKASWLSFEEDDASLRFRFSFGFEGYEDVASDPERQNWAAKLTDAIFPESFAVTENSLLNPLLQALLECKHPSFTERIVYFNAPNGGAQMHHDVERGHEGVIFAQMSGVTFWLALSKPRLMDEIESFLSIAPAHEWVELRKLAANRRKLSDYLEARDHEWAEALIDRSPLFVQQLIEREYAFVLKPGDALLLPQSSLDDCVWHSVFCLGDEAGEGMSFALKK